MEIACHLYCIAVTTAFYKYVSGGKIFYLCCERCQIDARPVLISPINVNNILIVFKLIYAIQISLHEGKQKLIALAISLLWVSQLLSSSSHTFFKINNGSPIPHCSRLDSHIPYIIHSLMSESLKSANLQLFTKP